MKRANVLESDQKIIETIFGLLQDARHYLPLSVRHYDK